MFRKFLATNGLDVKQYQIDGVKWCIERENAITTHPASPIVHGGILGDEMGLGKTFTMIGTMLDNFKLHTLIVLPSILVDQWREIIKNTLNHNAFVVLNVIKSHGGDVDEMRSLGMDFTKLKTAPIVITTYKLFEKNIHLLKQVMWDRIVFDEAHHLRNHKTKVHKAVVELRETIIKRGLIVIVWLITGTPIQNYLKDFYSLCRLLGLKKEDYYKNHVMICKLFMLKRTKKDVGLTLPPLKINMIEVDWESEEERELGQELHSVFSFAGIAHSSGKSDIDPLPYIVKAKQSCIDMSLLKNNIDKLIGVGAITDGEYIQKGIKHRSKLNKVIDFIVARGTMRKKLVFCHFHKEIDYLKTKLQENGFNVECFDGRVSKARRSEMLKKDLDVLILQIQTGCEGLNLQEFNEIYFVSTHWNPAIQDQAVARCHRIGQTKQVDVFIFVMKPFDEERKTTTIDIHCIQKHILKRQIMSELTQ